MQQGGREDEETEATSTANKASPRIPSLQAVLKFLNSCRSDNTWQSHSSCSPCARSSVPLRRFFVELASSGRVSEGSGTPAVVLEGAAAAASVRLRFCRRPLLIALRTSFASRHNNHCSLFSFLVHGLPLSRGEPSLYLEKNIETRPES